MDPVAHWARGGTKSVAVLRENTNVSYTNRKNFSDQAEPAVVAASAAATPVGG